MKRLFTLLITLITVFSLIGCSELNFGEKENDELENLSNNQDNVAPMEALSTTTYVRNDTYNYDNVIKYSDSFDIEAFAKDHNIETDNKYLVIDNYKDWVMVYSQITSLKMTLDTEGLNEFFKNYVYLIMFRKAGSSNFISVVYQFDSTKNELIKSYPHESDSGDEAIFECLDVVMVKKDIYNLLSNKSNNDNPNNEEDTKEYKLTVIDNRNIIESLKESYKAGEKVVVKTGILYDAGIEAFLDNKSIGTETSIGEGKTSHWEFYFTMPSHDATLSLRVYSGFNNYNESVYKYISSDILSHGIQDEIIYNYLVSYLKVTNSEEKGYIREYYGYYNNSFALMMNTNNGGFWMVIGEEIVDGVKINYSDSGRIVIYNGGEFYSLQVAFDKGLLNHNDLISIKNFNSPEKEVYSLDKILDKNDITGINLEISGARNETHVLGSKGINDFIEFIDVEYTISNALEIEELDGQKATGLYYWYNIKLNDGSTILIPITSFNRLIIYVNNKIYLSKDQVKLDSSLFEMDKEEVKAGVISIKLANEIKLSFVKENREKTGEITLAELDSIGIRYYHGCFNGYHIVMMDGIFDYVQEESSVSIDGVTFEYSDGNSLFCYKDGKFYPLKEVYDNGFLTKDDLQKISTLHSNSKENNIIISDSLNGGYKLIIVDDYNIILNLDDLINVTYKENDVVTVLLKFFSGPSVGILVDDVKIPVKSSKAWSYQMHEFVMPSHDVVITTTYNNNKSTGE